MRTLKVPRRNLAAVLIGALPIFLCTWKPCVASSLDQPPWYVGRWLLAEDEDGSRPGTDLTEFRADGRFVVYGPGCTESVVATYHVHNGDIFVSVEIPNKGPLAMVFRPSADHEKLTYTSHRTRNNAVYRRAPASICDPK
ncbi:hypothetical protein [Tahibacter soli]|uniref:Uncharacterized protein n=1 Tax=Tahibacter soli TaxID=2983605 RepID=A0A9X4BIQ8_9GAMM|nr:hypothetical protein [Tahibacter soli]MDC8013873.1 hypothetical protein [Tahibacter soli]